VGAAGVSEEKEKVEKREKLGGVSSRSHLGDGKASGQVDKQCKTGSESAARWGRARLVQLLFIPVCPFSSFSFPNLHYFFSHFSRCFKRRIFFL
jgi:hypothetical protein